MAMSRILSQTLPRSSLHPASLTPGALITHNRHRSNKTRQAQLIELEVDSSSTSSHPDSSEEVLTVGIKKLEEAIQSIIVRRAAPDWLPFLPGYSYWVPPRSSTMRHPHGMIEVIGKLTSSGVGTGKIRPQLDLLTEDETMSFTSARGWPSSTFFLEGTSPIHPIPLMEVEVKIHNEANNAHNASNSEEEEG
ncbi:uncharacterized protein LOC111412197 [Olea europaea var. sylvestris]|uniref:uncharacterized protein LOC111412197 n=1 Tax=Olea europaea var. sylvestris TaxID=158386 RepID=UPI000C1CEDF4|nr:uncharacterized protein LOC111412197 [Olea europaea var. sylvestris]